MSCAGLPRLKRLAIVCASRPLRFAWQAEASREAWGFLRVQPGGDGIEKQPGLQRGDIDGTALGDFIAEAAALRR